MSQGSANRTQSLWVEVSQLQKICYQILETSGFDTDTARLIADELIYSESLGTRSHGVMRLSEYVRAIECGELDVKAHPKLQLVSPTVAIISGNYCAGALVAKKCSETMNSLLEMNSLAAIAIQSSGHLGRLGVIGQRIAQAGNCVIGAFNYLGHGRRVAPSGAIQPLLATNPIMAAFPSLDSRHSGCSYLLDMSTSVVSEGRVRNAVREGRRIPRGWLAKLDGSHCGDGKDLYDNPPKAVLMPLGGASSGHKGLGISVVVELLAGVIAGAGNIAAPADRPGNGGFLLGFKPDLFGSSTQAIQAGLQATVEKLSEEISLSSPKQRLAGLKSIAAITLPRAICIDRTTYLELTALHTGKPTRPTSNKQIAA